MSHSEDPPLTVAAALERLDSVLRLVEFVAALLLVTLFAIGVFDLILNIYTLAKTGAITDPEEVIGLIDTVLLLFIIVELYETVVAYANESGLIRIVTIVLYTALIAVARKFIIFRTGEYATVEEALLAAAAYGFIGISLAILLVVFQRTTKGEVDRPRRARD